MSNFVKRIFLKKDESDATTVLASINESNSNHVILCESSKHGEYYIISEPITNEQEQEDVLSQINTLKGVLDDLGKAVMNIKITKKDETAP